MLRVRFERLRRGWSQTVLAYHAGLSASDVSRIENGMQRPYPKQAAGLARALDMRVERLLDEAPATK
jgi:transcriptional regulator with XRE-family HTH domain